MRTTRRLVVRRPDRLALQVTGDIDLRGWYDGQKLTFVSDQQKVWARVNGAPTIDDTLDRLADRLAMPMPMADFLYSSPFEALIGTKSAGGYVGRETIDGVPCVHVAYSAPCSGLGSLGRRERPSLAQEVPRHRQDVHACEDDGGHVHEVDVRCRHARGGVHAEVPAQYERVQIVVGRAEATGSAPLPADGRRPGPRRSSGT